MCAFKWVDGGDAREKTVQIWKDATQVDGRKRRTEEEGGACPACPRNNQTPLQLKQRKEKADVGSRVLEIQ